MKTGAIISHRTLLHLIYLSATQNLARLFSEGLLWLAKGLSFTIFVLLRYFVRYRQGVITKNLTKSFPSKTVREIRSLTREYYRHMSDLIIEPFLFYLVTPSIRKRLACYTNIDLIERLYRDHKQVILFASHYGNWEYLINLPQVASFPVFTAYSPVKNPFLDRAMLRLRSFLGVTLIPRHQFYRKALSLLRQKGTPKLLVLIADQRPAPGNDKFHIPFLHQNTAVQVGGERMAISADTAVVYIESNKTAQFKYDYTFRLLKNGEDEVPMGITTAYYKILEQNIRRAPAYWLWSHNRWKQNGVS